MILRYVQRLGLFIGGLGGLILLLFVYQHVDPLVFAVIRVGLLLMTFFAWRRVVDLLVSGGWIHPFRQSAAIAFRWRFLALVTMLELLVIQQLPYLIADVFRD